MGSQPDRRNNASAAAAPTQMADPSADASQPGPSRHKTQLLAQAVEREIIPRLVRAHAGDAAWGGTAAPHVSAIGEADISHLTHLLLHEDDPALQAWVAGLRQRGLSVQDIFLDLLAPSARQLGQMWECDLCNFTEVTVAMGRLQQLLRANSASFGLNNVRDGTQPEQRILLLPCPGEQHTFGLSVVAEFFYRAGWDVSTSFVQPSGSLSALVEREWFDVIGFSLGSEARLQLLEQSIQQVRRASMNPHVPIIVGGSIFSLQPGCADRISANAVILDAAQAPEMAAQLVTRLRVGP